MPNALATLAMAPFKAARRLASGLFSGHGGSGWGRLRVLRPGSQFDWQALAGPPEQNSAVAACLRFVVNNVAEPELVVTRTRGKGHRDPIDGFPMLRLCAAPNPAMDWDQLVGWLAMAMVVDGNAFAWKRRSRAGRVVELWPLHHWLMSPLFPADGSEWLTGWQYRVNSQVVTLDPADVIHVPWGLPDRLNDRLYEAPLKAAVREICTDNEAVAWGAALLKNGGVPAIAIVPQTDGDFLTLDQARELKQQYRENFTMDEAGGVFVPSGPVRLEKIGFSPAELAVDRLQMLPESRICAAIGVDPKSVGLLVGNSAGGAGGQFGTAREMADRASYQNCVMPLQKRLASRLASHLLPEFVGDPSAYRVGWDYTEVACLAEDADARSTRATEQLKAGAIMRSEARVALNLPATKDDEVYYLPAGMVVATGDHLPIASLAERRLSTDGDADLEGEDVGENPPGEDVTPDKPDAKPKPGEAAPDA